jgi:cellulose synthase (UDP-forming)
MFVRIRRLVDDSLYKLILKSQSKCFVLAMTEIFQLPSKKLKFSVAKIDSMSANERILFVLFFLIGGTLTVVFAFWWFNPSHVSHNFSGSWHLIDWLLFILLSYIVWLQIVMEVFAWHIAGYVKHPDANVIPQEGLRVAYMTAFVPGAEPYDILENTLKAMVRVEYPHDTWLLDEGDDSEAQVICKKYGVRHYSRKGKAHFNTNGGKFKAKTKGGNYNSWLEQHNEKYDIVAQHDVDFIPRKDFLMRTLGYFRDPNVAFVGTPQVYGNVDESWIARGAAEQTYGFYGPLQKGFYSHDMTLLIGANHIMRTEAYRDIDGYTAHIAEDMLTGMKLYTHHRKWTSVYVPEVLLIGEGPSTWESYFGQQMRWAYGCMDIVFRHAPILLPKMSFRRICNYILLQQFYFAGVAQAVGIVLLTLYFVFGITSARMTFLPILFLYVPLILYQVIFQLWLQRFNINPEKERGLHLRGKLLFIAAWPVFFLAFIGVMRNKKLAYVVTPKGGDTNKTLYAPTLFICHYVLGSITLLDLILGIYTHHDAIQLVFWAILNTVFMYGLFFSEALPEVGNGIKKSMNLYRQQFLRLGEIPEQNLGAITNPFPILETKEIEPTSL